MKQFLLFITLGVLYTTSVIGQCTLSFTSTNLTCENVCTGSATAIVTNGTEPISYYWNNGAMNQTIDYACAGTYSCSIFDAVGCSATQSVTISAPPAITFLPDTAHNETCFALCNGDATIYPVGGTPPYSYNWDNGQTTQQATSLCATYYFVTVTDQAGCNYYHNISMNGPTQIQNTPNIMPTYCSNASGYISVSTSGGTVVAGYNYLWSNGGTTSMIFSLSSGIYTVTVSDVIGCSVVDSYILNPSDGVIIDSLIPKNVTCYGMNNGGLANFSMHNGQPPFTYQWTGQPQRPIPALDPVGPGNYYLTITANGCNSYGMITITEPSAIVSHASVVNPYCYGDSTGSIYLMPTGGNGQFYTFTWGTLPLITEQFAGNLTAGTYPLSITDFNGCTLAENITVTEPPQLIANVIPVDISCNGFNDGKVIINMTGGTYPYYFSLDSMNWDTTNTILLSAGQYSLYIKDQHYCHIPITPFTIIEPQLLFVSSSVTNPTCTDNDGNIHLSTTGGVPPYSFIWNNNSIDSTVTGLPQGLYEVTITDTHGCTDIQYYNLSPSSYLAKLWGNVSYSGGILPANEAKLYLFGNSNTGGAAQIDTISSTINSATTWEFINLLPGTYYLKANILNPSSFPNVLNSYYDTTFEWQNAIPIVLTCDDTVNITLNMVNITPMTTGNGCITGTVNMLGGVKSTNAYGEPVPGAEILIEQEPNDVPVQCAYTDTAGQYTFTGLNPGNGYHMIVQIPGFPQINTYQNITVVANDTLPNLNFILDTVVGIYKDTASYVSQLSINGVSLEVYPNPFVTDINVKLNLTKSSNVSYELYDELGQTLIKSKPLFMKEGNNEFNIIPKNNNSGICYLMIKSDKTILIKKLISIKK